MDSAEQNYAQAVVETVRDLSEQFAAHTRNGDEARKELVKTVEESQRQLKTSVERMVAAMREDVHKAILALQLNDVDHKAAHEADRVERVTRQTHNDAQFLELRKWLIFAIIGIVAIGAFLVGWLVF